MIHWQEQLEILKLDLTIIIPCWALHVHVAKHNSILHYDSCILFPSSQDDFHIQLGMKKQYAASYGNFWVLHVYWKVLYSSKFQSKSLNCQMYEQGTIMETLTWQKEIRDARLSRTSQESTQGYTLGVRTPVGVVSRMFGVASHYQVYTNSQKYWNLFH